jgi:O-acetyl-ADP-ribose deacetylase (regulator of RNase III)
MIQDVSGDILLSKADLVAHGVAPNDDFHHGLALALRDRWPGMYKDFRHYCHVSHPKSGSIWTWAGPGVRIAALFTQEEAYGHGAKPGRAHLNHVNHALRELHKFIESEKITSVALPRLATGVGGLEWTDVRPLIEEHLGKIGIPVYVYSTYISGQEPSVAGA